MDLHEENGFKHFKGSPDLRCKSDFAQLTEKTKKEKN